MATVGFAQGYITFNATGNPTVDTNTALSPLFGGSGAGGITGLTASGTTSPGAFYYALLVTAQGTYGTVSSDTSVWDGTWTAVPFGAGMTNSITAGRVAAPPGNTSVSGVVNNLAQSWVGNSLATGGTDSTTNDIVLVGWSSTLGTTWAAAAAELNAIKLGALAPANSFFGESAMGYLAPNSASPGANIFSIAATPNGLPIDNNGAALAMQLYSVNVPEPTTMALAGLGGLALLLFRRRK